MGFKLAPYRLITIAANDNLSHAMVSPLFKSANMAKNFAKSSRCVAFCCEIARFIGQAPCKKSLGDKVFDSHTNFTRD